MFDVGVIGAGIHGASAAFHLGSMGLRTVIFDRDGPASGPTGRSSGICRAYYTNPFLARIARDSMAMFRRFEEITNGGDAGFRETGLVFLHPPGDIEKVRANVERLNDLAVVTELLEPKELAARFPMFDLEGIGVGAWEAHAGYADPAGATAGLFRRAVELGAEARLGRPVTGIELGPGEVSVIAADGERTVCSKVLVAGGPWTRTLLGRLGVELPLTVERHIVGVFRWGDTSPVPAHGDLVGGYYLRPEGQELFLVGSLHPAPTVDPDDFSETVTAEESRALAAPVVARVPHLESAEVHGGWASLYDVSPDWQPVIGEVAPGVFVDAGTSGHGFKIAPALGRHVAHLIAGDEVDPELRAFHPSRFEEARLLGAGYGRARILG